MPYISAFIREHYWVLYLSAICHTHRIDERSLLKLLLHYIFHTLFSLFRIKISTLSNNVVKSPRFVLIIIKIGEEKWKFMISAGMRNKILLISEISFWFEIPFLFSYYFFNCLRLREFSLFSFYSHYFWNTRGKQSSICVYRDLTTR